MCPLDIYFYCEGSLWLGQNCGWCVKELMLTGHCQGWFCHVDSTALMWPPWHCAAELFCWPWVLRKLPSSRDVMMQCGHCWQFTLLCRIRMVKTQNWSRVVMDFGTTMHANGVSRSPGSWSPSPFRHLEGAADYQISSLALSPVASFTLYRNHRQMLRDHIVPPKKMGSHVCSLISTSTWGWDVYM